MNAPVLDPVKLAAELIRRPSVTPAEAGVLDTLSAALEMIGFTCRRMPFQQQGTERVDNLYAKFTQPGADRQNKPRHFCFAGHVDVVPVGKREAWSIDPFGGEIVNGRLYGRGAADMKGAVAAFSAAAGRFLAKRGNAFSGSISLLITGDEEGPAYNGTKPMLETLAAEGETWDACLVGEPTNPQKLGEMAKIGRRGSFTGYLRIRGIQGHTAYPHLADNPIHRLSKMIAALTETPLDRGTEHFQPTSLQFTTVDVGNPASNVIPGEVLATFNARFNDSFTIRSFEAEIRRRLDDVGGEYDLTIGSSSESFLTPVGRLSEIVSEAIARELGRAPELSTTGGTSDARFIKDYCPVIEFGLAGQTMHKVDENVPVADIQALSRIYETVLEAFFDDQPR
ncbi:succinyl-diaminopimelate desuccinylase [Dongia soli]|uniref:Succinyl-diaminopimelate desuccinylase n=1 Tax=Dongia soli TaxID=600628 RepID=A0ABU5E637_9PROT|nr:succinyl-diaminopimelate desuccinylase [Dongia soli]MDY0881663.1 succinyl-diaminopimelate desuccinylase [Dongia soli]